MIVDTFRKLRDFLNRRERRNFWFLAAGAVIVGFLNMVGVAAIIPFLAVLADPGLVNENAFLAWLHGLSGAETELDFLIVLGICVVLAYVFALVLKAGHAYATVRFAARRRHAIAQRMITAYIAQPYPWFLGRHSSEITKRITGEVGLVVQKVMVPCLNLMSATIIVFFMVVLMVAVDPLIALFLAGILVGSYVSIYLALRRRVLAIGTEQRDTSRLMFRRIVESFSGIKAVKVRGLERMMLRRISRPSWRMTELAAMAALINQLPRHALEGLAFGGMMTVVLILAATNEGDLAKILPIAGVYALAGSRIMPAMQQVYRQVQGVRMGLPTLDSLHEDYMALRHVPLQEAPASPVRLEQSIRLDALSYAYPNAERDALDGLDLEIPARSSIGIVGGTGAGKTTAIDVILGLLAPRSGRLLVDGEAIADEAARTAWRASIGYVPQGVFLIDDSIAANIAFGIEEAEIDRAAVERAARMAQLHDFVVSELPEGYDSKIGEGGARLSGGQRQRIGIARALYSDPDVLVLDEATSALDTITERAVMRAVAAIGGIKTVVMVAHRLTTVRDCDRIFLLERGRVAASGSYAELIEKSAIFREMAREPAPDRPALGVGGAL